MFYSCLSVFDDVHVEIHKKFFRTQHIEDLGSCLMPVDIAIRQMVKIYVF